MDDVVAIQNLKARYCIAADSSPDQRDQALQDMMALFTQDVIADFGFGPMEGPQAFATFVRDAIAGGSEWMVHNVHTPLIEVDGERATGRWTVNVRMKRNETGAIEFVFGRYSDAFRRVDGEWKIERVEFRRYE